MLVDGGGHDDAAAGVVIRAAHFLNGVAQGSAVIQHRLEKLGRGVFLLGSPAGLHKAGHGFSLIARPVVHEGFQTLLDFRLAHRGGFGAGRRSDLRRRRNRVFIGGKGALGAGGHCAAGSRLTQIPSALHGQGQSDDAQRHEYHGQHNPNRGRVHLPVPDHAQPGHAQADEQVAQDVQTAGNKNAGHKQKRKQPKQENAEQQVKIQRLALLRGRILFGYASDRSVRHDGAPFSGTEHHHRDAFCQNMHRVLADSLRLR